MIPIIFYTILWQLVAMSKRLGYLFKVLTGNATGHYDLDMSKPLDRLAGIPCNYCSRCRYTFSLQLRCKLFHWYIL